MNGQIKPGINKPPVTYDYPWQSCICSSSYAITKKIQSEYYNNYFSGDEGMILLEPQKERYQLGERVQITYVPSVDTRLVRWDVDPASHTAKWSREPSSYIYITNNTTVTAVIRQQKNLMLNVHILNPEYGDVSSFSAFYDYGSTVSPHISPDPGYVCNWLFAPVSYKSRLYNDENPSIYMEGSVSLSVVYEGEDDRFSYGPISTISIDGGTGKILASNGYCCCTHDDNDIFHQCGCATGPYLRNSVTRGQGYFSARCIPDPDFSFGYWTFNDGHGDCYSTHNEIDSLPATDASALTAHLVPTISLEVQVEGQGVVTSGGFRSYYPSRIYYTSTYLDTFKGERIDANRVQMQHNACPGWGFDHWEIQDAQGAWTTVLNTQGQTEIGDLTVYMNWSGPSNQIHPPENQERFRVKAVFVIEPELLVIVSGTQFSYYNNTCSISAKVFPDNGNYTWRLTPIEGANLTIYNNTQNQSDVLFKYTNLPTHNDEFGYKELAVTNLCNGKTASKTIEVFFDKSGTDHPPISANEASDYYSQTPWTHSVVLPNWFYYWRQTSAGNVQPAPLYHHTISCAGWDTFKQEWCVWIGQGASSDYSIFIGADNNLTLNVNKDNILWASAGIDTFAWVCRHEASHVGWYKQWYPGGTSQISAFSADGDSIDDMWELTSGYNTSIPDSNNDLQLDCEDLTIRTQDIWIHYAAQLEDWANPGQQYDPTN
ncbi:MAG: hypothetical protein GX602_04725 [Dehalococcoidales bacterium]|nr:hypothetical protein [Dehalococcoidales bacterium]